MSIIRTILKINKKIYKNKLMLEANSIDLKNIL